MQPVHTGLISPDVLGALSGLEFFEKVVSGALPHPPIAGLMNLRIVKVETGLIHWETQAPEQALNPMGGVHGGFAMTVLDSALGCAIHSCLPAGRGYTTIEAKVNITRPVPLGATLYCEGRMITLGRRVGTSEAKLTDANGRVLAFGTSSLLIFDV